MALGGALIGITGMAATPKGRDYKITAETYWDYGTGTFIYYAPVNQYDTIALKVQFVCEGTNGGMHMATDSNLTNESNTMISATARRGGDWGKPILTTTTGTINGNVVGDITDYY